jgi:hypothetical protein
MSSAVYEERLGVMDFPKVRVVRGIESNDAVERGVRAGDMRSVGAGLKSC